MAAEARRCGLLSRAKQKPQNENRTEAGLLSGFQLLDFVSTLRYL